MKKKYKTYIFFLLIFFMQIWFLSVVYRYPYIGAELSQSGHAWEVSYTDSFSKANLLVGDVVLEVDDKPLEVFPSFIRWHTLEQAKSILISRNGVEHLIDISGLDQITSLDILALFGELISFVIAFILYRWMNAAKSGKYLSFVFISIGATFMCAGASIRGDVLGKISITTGIIIVPIILAHFLIVFLHERLNLRVNTGFFKYLYSIFGLFFLIRLLSFKKSDWSFDLYFVSNIIVTIFFVIGVSLNLTILFYVYMKHGRDNRDLSVIIRTIWGSLFASFSPLAFLSLIPQVLLGREFVDPFYSSWAALFFPLSFTYLLAAKKLYDIDLVVRRFILTVILAIPTSGAMVAIIAFLYPSFCEFDRIAIMFFLFVFAISLTLYSFEYLTTKLERVIFPRKYQLQVSLKNISKNLGNISNFHDFKDIILIDIINTLQVLGGAIIFRHQDSVEVIAEGNMDPDELKALSETSLLLHPLYTVYEISRNEEYSCFLVLAAKKTNTYFGQEEKQWLGLIVSYLSVSMENLHLIRKLTMRLNQLAAHLPSESESSEIAWFRKLMFELQEKERVRIATDLHDTTMQDLFFLKRRFNMLRERLAHDAEIQSQLTSMIDYIDVINMNLRQSCFELHPHLLKEVGLIRTIQKLVDLEAGTAPYKVEFYASKAMSVESCSIDFKRHVFRMVQELLNNARKHANPTYVRLELAATHTHLFLFYEDDGVGLDLNTEQNDHAASHLGMIYLKSRVLSLGGKFELDSNEGEGLRFMADFPLSERRTAS